MRKWLYSSNPHSAFMSDDYYFGIWSKISDMYVLYEPVKGDVVCMIDRKIIVDHCKENDLNVYTYILYIFERYIDKYNDECIAKVKDNIRICGNCTHLIFKNHHRQIGRCSKTGILRNFEDICTREEEMS